MRIFLSTVFVAAIVSLFAPPSVPPASAGLLDDILIAPKTLIDRAIEARSNSEIFKDNEIVVKVNIAEVLRRELLRLSEKVSRRLRKHGVAGRTVTLKLRYANFSTITRSKTVDRPLDDATQLHRTVALLLDALRLERVRVRLVGVRVTNLVPAGAARQLSMTADDRWQQLERAADSARDRFGDGSVTRGALLDE